MTIKFTCRHFPSEIILQSVRYYLFYKLSYREIEEVLAERGINVDYSTLNRWVIKYAPLLEHRARGRKKLAPSSTKAIGHNGLSEKVVIDKSDANALALHNINVQLWLMGKMLNLIEVLQVKYLNNLVKQSHRKVKGKIHQCLGWKSVRLYFSITLRQNRKSP